MLRKTILILIMLFQLPAPFALAANAEVLGRTYPIIEKDALQEIEEKVKAVNWDSIIKKSREKAVENYRPGDLKNLPRSTQTKSYLVDMTYEMEFDVPDGRGGILYPKGYAFNPLDYKTFSSTLIVIDGTDPDQVEWFKHSPYTHALSTKLLLSDGAHLEAADVLDRPVFYLNEIIAKRFQLQAVPSVVKQNGRYMEVQQIDVDSIKK